MQLTFSPRQGVQMTTTAVLQFARALRIITDDNKSLDLFMEMKSEPYTPPEGSPEASLAAALGITLTKRLGKIYEYDREADMVGEVVWEGELPAGPPPTRAFAVAAGLCDEDGSSDIPPPDWVASRLIEAEA